MAKNPPYGDNHRHGQVTDRSQTYNPHNDRWVIEHLKHSRIRQLINNIPLKLCVEKVGFNPRAHAGRSLQNCLVHPHVCGNIFW